MSWSDLSCGFDNHVGTDLSLSSVVLFHVPNLICTHGVTCTWIAQILVSNFSQTNPSSQALGEPDFPKLSRPEPSFSSVLTWPSWEPYTQHVSLCVSAKVGQSTVLGLPGSLSFNTDALDSRMASIPRKQEQSVTLNIPRMCSQRGRITDA